jgi:hypothetical protein
MQPSYRQARKVLNGFAAAYRTARVQNQAGRLSAGPIAFSK